MILASSFKVRSYTYTTRYASLVDSKWPARFWRLERKREGRGQSEEVVVEEAGVKPEKLKWITLVDGQRITLNGIRPRMTSIFKSKRDPAEILEEMSKRCGKNCVKSNLLESVMQLYEV